MSTLPPLLSVKGLYYSFSERKVIQGVSFDLERGDVLSLVGPNGVGKTTLLRLIAGIIPLRENGGSGLVQYLGQDFLDTSAPEKAARVVYLPADVKTEFPLTAFELVQLGRLRSRVSFLGELSKEDLEKIRSAMELCGCWELRDREYHTLSGGERQLVCFARGIAQEAKVLLLDESFSRLDLHHQSKVGKLLGELASQGYAFILVSHDLNFVLEYSTSCLVWPATGSAIQGPIKDVITDARIRALYPGASIFTGLNPRTGALKLFFDQ